MNPNLRNALSVALALALGATAPLALAQQAPPPAGQSAPMPTTPPADANADVPDASMPADAAPADAMPADVAQATDPAADYGLRPPASNAPNPAVPDPSLRPVFKEFGEVAGLTALMDDFMVNLLADARTRAFFENADQTRIKAHLVQQFCVILGGPCTYEGKDMKTAHAGLGIDRAAFNALVEDLQKAMNHRGVPFRAQNKLLAKLAPMYRQIEER